MRYNCPNCGAGITGERCEFCGTVIYDFAALQVGAPAYVKIWVRDRLYMFRLVVDDFRLEIAPQYTHIRDAVGVIQHQMLADYNLNVSLDAHGLPLGESGALVIIKGGET